MGPNNFRINPQFYFGPNAAETSALCRNVGTSKAAQTPKSLKKWKSSMVIIVPTTVVCRYSPITMGGIELSYLWGNCEPSNAGTLTTGGTIIRKHTKC